MKYVAIEGMDGSGKSTLVDGLCAHYAGGAGTRYVMRVKEPGYMAPELRSLVLKADFPLTRDGREIVLQADRALLSAQIKQWTGSGDADLVISDRSFLSGRVYSATYDVDTAFIRRLEKAALWRYPDLILVLDLDPEESHRRTMARLDAVAHQKLTYEEQGGLPKFHQIRQGFLDQTKALTESAVRVIDCNSKTQSDVLEEAVGLINQFYGGNENG